MIRPLPILVSLLLLAAPSAAQTPFTHAGPVGALEFTVGRAALIDDAPIDHVVMGVGGRVYFSPRASMGPEVVFAAFSCVRYICDGTLIEVNG